MNRTSKHVKVLFEYEGSESSHEIESMWTIPVDGGYEIDNIPFFAREIASRDVVKAMPGPDGLLRFESLIKPSGHSTLRLWFAEGKEQDVPRIRQQLRDMSCDSELCHFSRLVAIDVPPNVPYSPVRELLNQYETEGLLEYEEACLGQQAG